MKKSEIREMVLEELQKLNELRPDHQFDSEDTGKLPDDIRSWLENVINSDDEIVKVGFTKRGNTLVVLNHLGLNKNDLKKLISIKSFSHLNYDQNYRFVRIVFKK